MKKAKSIYWLYFSPFLVFFILFILFVESGELVGDEARYLMFANNLCHGFYSPLNEINLWNGPGYPIILVPFISLKSPIILIKLFNALLQYLSIILLFKSILLYAREKTAYFFTLCWAFYFVAYQELPRIITETFTSFLIALIIYFILKAFSSSSKKYIVGSGITIGYLVLTKIIFGYVLLAAFSIYCIILLANQLLIKKNIAASKKIFSILIIASLTVAPYLCYTYSVTGKMMYFGNSGGMSLYWMSTPYENEYGEWNNDTFDAWCKNGRPCNAEFIANNHQKDFDILKQYKGVEKDEMYKKIAARNIKNHPIKYLRNCLSNLGRMWFGYPTSAFYQQDVILIRFIPNSILLTFFILTIPLWLKNLSKCRFEINFLMVFIFLYLGASTLISAYPRQLYVIVPVLLVWFSFLLPRIYKINEELAD